MYCPKCGSVNVLTERRPDGDSKCLDCGTKWKSSSWEDVKEPSVAKSKRIQQEKWAVVQSGIWQLLSVHDSLIEANDSGLDSDYVCVPCTISFEIPVDEPKITLTPSEFDKIWADCRSESYPVGLISVEDLKYKLFPDWQEGHEAGIGAAVKSGSV